MIHADVRTARESIEWTDERLRTALAGLTDAAVVGPSHLPGWSRGHVLAHLAGIGEAVIRQLTRALTGEGPVDLYDGGRPARDAAIEALADDPAQAHVTRVGAVLDRVEGVLDALDDHALARPTGYHGLPAGAVVLLWWREVSIHLVDLDLGVRHTFWGAELREHLATFLASRVPAGVRLDLEPTDVDEPRWLGEGTAVRVRGTANDLTAWLAGRRPLAGLHADVDGAPTDLPELGPWP